MCFPYIKKILYFARNIHIRLSLILKELQQIILILLLNIKISSILH